MLSAFVYRNNLLITKYKTILLQNNSMHMLLIPFYNIFVGVQVIPRAKAHDHQLVKFVLYFSVENLETQVLRVTFTWIVMKPECTDLLQVVASPPHCIYATTDEEISTLNSRHTAQWRGCSEQLWTCYYMSWPVYILFHCFMEFLLHVTSTVLVFTKFSESVWVTLQPVEMIPVNW
jgi:hypothetical protein